MANTAFLREKSLSPDALHTRICGKSQSAMMQALQHTGFTANKG
jgi:hypothetical protein